MAYTILVHEQRGQTRHLEIDSGVRDDDGNAVVHSFDWGMDVSLATVKREMKALLAAQYGDAAKPLAGVGTTL